MQPAPMLQLTEHSSAPPQVTTQFSVQSSMWHEATSVHTRTQLPCGQESRHSSAFEQVETQFGAGPEQVMLQVSASRHSVMQSPTQDWSHSATSAQESRHGDSRQS